MSKTKEKFTDEIVRKWIQRLMNHAISYEKGTSSKVEEYKKAGVKSGHEGFVLTLSDGTEFQVTIVRSK